jgi:hypothetical protein
MVGFFGSELEMVYFLMCRCFSVDASMRLAASIDGGHDAITRRMAASVDASHAAGNMCWSVCVFACLGFSLFYVV